MNKLLVMLLLSAAFIAACGQSGDNEEANVKDDSSQSTAEGDDALKIDPRPEREGKVVARVNGVPIYEDELKGRPVQYLITDEILYQKGLGLGLDAKYADTIRDYKKHLVVHDIRTGILEDLPPTKEVSDEEIESYYESYPAKYSFVRIHEVAFVDKSLGDEIYNKVKNGEDLTEIVNAYTESGANVVGKDLGYNRELLNQFDTIEVGSVSDVLSKPDGTYSVIKIVEIKPIPLYQAERGIRQLLEAKRKTFAQNRYANEIVKENNIKIEIMDNNN